MEKGSGRVRDGFGMFGMASGWVWEATNFVNAGFWRLRAPETSIWAPEGAFWPKKAIFPSFFHVFFEGIWNFSGLQGGCASSRLDHGLKTRAGRLR